MLEEIDVPSSMECSCARFMTDGCGYYCPRCKEIVCSACYQSHPCAQCTSCNQQPPASYGRPCPTCDTVLCPACSANHPCYLGIPPELSSVETANLLGRAMDGQWQHLVKPDRVSLHLIHLFRDIIDFQFHTAPEDLRHDAAIVCAFFQSSAFFQSFFLERVDPLIEEKWSALGEGGMMRVFTELMSPRGFSRTENVVLVGDAGLFQHVLKNFILFKDMTGAMHGEHSHNLQFLSLCCLEADQSCIEGEIRLRMRVCDLYAALTEHTTRTTMPQEIFGSSTTVEAPRIFTMWDYCVDAFLGSAHRCLLTDLYTDSFRCPAFWTQMLKGGTLSNCFMGEYLRKRHQRIKETQGKLTGNEFRKYAKDRVAALGLVVLRNVSFSPQDPLFERFKPIVVSAQISTTTVEAINRRGLYCLDDLLTAGQKSLDRVRKDLSGNDAALAQFAELLEQASALGGSH